MEENTTIQQGENTATPTIDVEKARAQLEDFEKRNTESLEAMKEGKGILTLEKPIEYDDEKITQLPYDFTELTGLEYADAMDSDPNSRQAYRITYRQGLALFARAAAKQIEQLDMKDIIERIGIADAVEGVQLATLFFNASTRAGRLRISKK